MAQTGVVSWSQTAASNASADSSVNWAEGMAPSAVNDSARAEMSSVAKYRDDNAGALTTAGTSTAYTLTTNQVFSALTVLNGQSLRVKFNAANGASPTLNVDGLGAKAIQVSTATAVGTGVIGANTIWDVTYNNAIPAFILSAVPAQVQDATVATASLAASAVTYAKIQNVTDQKVLGNFTGSPAAPSEYALSGAAVSGSTISFPGPVPATFKNLSIKVATNTTVTVAADYVAVTDGTSFQTKAFSGTVNLGTTGANALDTGVIAIDTWYSVWCIAKSDGTTATLASTSATAPSPMPTGYTYKARVGWVRTIHASATLYGTWQLGRKARYIVGLAQTTTLPAIATGAVGAYSSTAPTWVAASISSLVPTATAGEIIVRPTLSFNGGSIAQITVAPSSSYLGWQSSSPPPFDSSNYSGGGLASNTSTSNVTMMIESTNIYWTSTTTSGAVFCVGWEDNI